MQNLGNALGVLVVAYVMALVAYDMTYNWVNPFGRRKTTE